MEITEEIKKENILSDDEQKDLFYTLLSGKTIKETIETSRGSFVVKYPKQKDLLLIDRIVAEMRGGINASLFNAEETFNMRKVAFLNVVIESGEAWYNNLKNKNKAFSWEEMPDEDFVNEVFFKAYMFRLKIQKELKPNEGAGNKTISDGESVSSSMGNGIFEGIEKTS